MTSFLLRHSTRYSYAKTLIARYVSQQTARGGRIQTRPTAGQDPFKVAGLSPAVAALLHIAFPNVQEPTVMQKKLIHAITSNRDVLLQDDTGTGKSFAVMLALLSKLPVHASASVGEEKPLSGLLIVPHRDLAYQYLHWIHRLTQPDGDAVSSLKERAQVLVRHVDKSTLQGLPLCMQEAVRSASCDLDALIRELPHILIATPNALLELIHVCRPLMPSAIVVDEVDALLGVPGNKLKQRTRTCQEKLGKHVPDLVRILDRIYPTSRSRVGLRGSSSSIKQETFGQGDAPAKRPQLIMISATLRSRFRDALFNTFGWMQRGKVAELIRKRSSTLPAHRLGRSAVHHVLIVSNSGDIKNIAGAEPGDTSDAILEEKTGNETDGDDVGLYEGEVDTELVGDVDKGLLHAPLAFDTAMLDAVAATFALDVPRAALLVLPATAAVRKIIFELQQMGVNAQPLDLVANEASRAQTASHLDGALAEDPVLIVATLATMRGIDLPNLSHVFMLGVPEGRSGDTYLHVAGRVGRFGRRGKVVTILEERKESRTGNRVVVTDAPKKMTMLFSRIGVQPTRLEHFD